MGRGRKDRGARGIAENWSPRHGRDKKEGEKRSLEGTRGTKSLDKMRNHRHPGQEGEQTSKMVQNERTPGVRRTKLSLGPEASLTGGGPVPAPAAYQALGLHSQGGSPVFLPRQSTSPSQEEICIKRL